MSSEPIISVSGLRGVVGESLTPEVAQRYVAAFLATLPPGPIAVTRDGRANGVELAETVCQAVAASGRTCHYGGVAATPTLGVWLQTLGAAGGVQVSASHNPPQYNGLKLFSREGRVLPAAAGEPVLAGYRELAASGKKLTGDAFRAPSPGPQVIRVAETSAEHLARVAAVCDVDRIRRRRFRVLLDANHGSGSVLGRPLLELLGCELILLGGDPDGLFSHPPEPTEANLASVAAQVADRRVDVAFCQDPDADRLAIIDERGRYVGEEYTLALCVDHVLGSGRRGPIVTNCSTSRMTEDLAAKYRAPFFRSKVGEANVVDRMLAEGAVLGGEGSGGVIDPRVVLVRDSFVGMALVLDALAAREAPLSALADELPRYAIAKTTVELPRDAIGSALEQLPGAFPAATADRLDGLRLDFADGAWLLVRPSNTEPIVRLIAECPTAEAAAALCRQATAALTERPSGDPSHRG